MNFTEFRSLIEEKIGMNTIFEEDGDSYYSAKPHKQEGWYNRKDLEIKKGNDILDEQGWVGAMTSKSGASGGNCWGDEAEDFSDYISKPFPFLVKILELVCPNIPFLLYNKIPVKDGYYSESEYYGNYTDYYFDYVNIKELFDFLVANNQIEDNGKSAVIIGGLPLSGKTTLAKTVYKDHFLIDDPRDLENDVINQLQDKVVITCPHLSFKKNRENLTKMLRDRGYSVIERVLDVKKITLLARAKKEGKTDRVEFIKNFKVEV